AVCTHRREHAQLPRAPRAGQDVEPEGPGRRQPSLGQQSIDRGLHLLPGQGLDELVDRDHAPTSRRSTAAALTSTVMRNGPAAVPTLILSAISTGVNVRISISADLTRSSLRTSAWTRPGMIGA